MRERLALIDLDTLMYIVAYSQFTNGNKDNPELVKIHTKEFINTILINTRADYVSMVYQEEGHQNFRKYFYPDYKSKRPDPPEFLVLWKSTVLETFKELGAVGVKIIESDDVLNIGYYKFSKDYEVITVSGDKDLNQIPGEHYNPRKNQSYYVTYNEAKYNLYIQLLMGDSTDDIAGIPNVGKVKASKLLENKQVSEYTKVCYDAYRDCFEYTWYSAYRKTFSLVNLLQTIDYNAYPFNQEVPELFNIKSCTDYTITNLFI